MDPNLFGWILLTLGAADCGIGLFFIRQAENAEDIEKVKGKKITGYALSGTGFLFLLVGGGFLTGIFSL